MVDRSAMSRGLGMGGHQSHAMGKDEWLTPPEIVRALGEFDLDPCAPVKRPWDTASRHFTVFDNGLMQPWSGRVWLNPPYGREAEKWMMRLMDHGQGTALIFARTETAAFFSTVWARASALLFLKGRLHFHHVTGERAAHNSGAPSGLIAVGRDDDAALAAAHRSVALDGALVWGWSA